MRCRPFSGISARRLELESALHSHPRDKSGEEFVGSPRNSSSIWLSAANEYYVYFGCLPLRERRNAIRNVCVDAIGRPTVCLPVECVTCEDDGRRKAQYRAKTATSCWILN